MSVSSLYYTRYQKTGFEHGGWSHFLHYLFTFEIIPCKLRFSSVFAFSNTNRLILTPLPSSDLIEMKFLYLGTDVSAYPLGTNAPIFIIFFE